MEQNQVLIEAADLFGNMIDDHYFIPVRFAYCQGVDILRFYDANGLIGSQADADRFYKAFHFAFSVAVRGGWKMIEEHIGLNFGPIEFVGILPVEEAKRELGDEVMSELAYQF